MQPRTEKQKAYYARGKKEVKDVNCIECMDKGFVKMRENNQNKWSVVPCPRCNPDGQDGITG